MEGLPSRGEGLLATSVESRDQPRVSEVQITATAFFHELFCVWGVGDKTPDRLSDHERVCFLYTSIFVYLELCYEVFDKHEKDE